MKAGTSFLTKSCNSLHYICLMNTSKLLFALFFALIFSFQAFTQETIRGDWFNLNYAEDLQLGVLVDRAYASMLEGKSPKPVIVAVIDSGVDIEHEDLRSQLWVNTDEIPDNGIDDDGNGYIDDVHGWSFISGPGGDVHHDNLEFTRVYGELHARFKDKDKKSIARADKKAYAEYLLMQKQYTSRVQKAKEELEEFQQVADFYYFAKQQMLEIFGSEGYSVDDVRKLESEDELAIAIRDFMVYAMENDFARELDNGLKHFRGAATYSYNLDISSRDLVGDDPKNFQERFYGTPRVTGPASDHGTHVAGIIGAARANQLGIDGIASAARIMAIRAVPDGDERDKDIANAIRYAVDNGARIINMSFGKSYSPQKYLVDDAVRYAESKGVLLVHAAGNSSENNDKNNNFPNPVYEDTREVCTTWIEVGASGPTLDALAAEFTNYGRKSVDLFAPGVDILSTMPVNEYAKNSGTSMAAPVVSGVAALILSYYPELTGKQVREILVNSYTDLGSAKVILPGSDKPKSVPFKKLSRTGGVVNAYNALKMAQEYSERP